MLSSVLIVFGFLLLLASCSSMSEGMFIFGIIFIAAGVAIVKYGIEDVKKNKLLQAENEKKRLKEIEVEQQKQAEMEIERRKNAYATMARWESDIWKDRTKKISKLMLVKIEGYYDYIAQRWHDRPMDLIFYFAKEKYSLQISRAQAIVAKENLSVPAPLFFYEDVVSKQITKRMMLFFYQNNWYYTFDDIDIQDAIVLVEATYKYEKEKLQREVEHAKGILSADTLVREDSRTISDSVKTVVWNRDGGRCVQCGSQKNLEFDHVIPFSKGGSNTARNIQILCQDCNRKKGSNIV